MRRDFDDETTTERVRVALREAADQITPTTTVMTEAAPTTPHGSPRRRWRVVVAVAAAAMIGATLLVVGQLGKDDSRSIGSAPTDPAPTEPPPTQPPPVVGFRVEGGSGATAINGLEWTARIAGPDPGTTDEQSEDELFLVTIEAANPSGAPVTRSLVDLAYSLVGPAGTELDGSSFPGFTFSVEPGESVTLPIPIDLHSLSLYFQAVPAFLPAGTYDVSFRINVADPATDTQHAGELAFPVQLGEDGDLTSIVTKHCERVIDEWGTDDVEFGLFYPAVDFVDPSKVTPPSMDRCRDGHPLANSGSVSRAGE